MCIKKLVSSLVPSMFTVICVKNHEHRHEGAKLFHILIYGMNVQLTA